MSTIVTHPAPHQADEVTAICILRILNPNVRIVRTRDPVLMQTLSETENAFLLDVGGQYNANKLMFDHHQPEGAGYRNPINHEWPYATAGLIWKHYGAKVVKKLYPELSHDNCQEVADYLDAYLIKYLDAIDCGVRIKSGGPSLSAVIASFNPSWFEAQEEDSFPIILDLSQVVLKNFIRRYAGKILARDRVRNSKTMMDGTVLVLDHCLPWSDVVALEMPDVMLVVYPVVSSVTGETQWQLKTAVSKNNLPRIMLPRQWGGLEGQRLAAVTAVNDVVFCHRSSHLAGTYTLEAALALASKAIESHNELMLQPQAA